MAGAVKRVRNPVRRAPAGSGGGPSKERRRPRKNPLAKGFWGVSRPARQSVGWVARRGSGGTGRRRGLKIPGLRASGFESRLPYQGATAIRRRARLDVDLQVGRHPKASTTPDEERSPPPNGGQTAKACSRPATAARAPRAPRCAWRLVPRILEPEGSQLAGVDAFRPLPRGLETHAHELGAGLPLLHRRPRLPPPVSRVSPRQGVPDSRLHLFAFDPSSFFGGRGAVVALKRTRSRS